MHAAREMSLAIRLGNSNARLKAAGASALAADIVAIGYEIYEYVRHARVV
jgi:hypothetical protein